jgi:hypothetical protein
MLVELLRQVFELYDVAGQANEQADPSVLQRPSIIPHAQNRNRRRWTLVYDLIWREWAYLDVTYGEASRQYVTEWRRIPYQGFRRLVLAAIAHSMHFSPTEKLGVLLHV